MRILRSGAVKAERALFHFETIPASLLLLVALFPDGQNNRRSLKAEGTSNAVFKIPLIGEMEQPPVIAEHHKMRRLYADLRHVIDFQAAALIRGGLHPGLCVCQNRIQHTRGHAEGRLICHVIDQIKQLFHPLPGLGLSADDGGIYDGECALRLIARCDDRV